MPSSSSRCTRPASVYRAGARVKRRSRRASATNARSPSSISGRGGSRSTTPPSSSPPSRHTRRNPSNAVRSPVAASTMSPSCDASSTRVRSTRAAAIWLATGALPDERVEPRHVLADTPGERLRRAREVRRPDRLVRLPGVARGGAHDPRLRGQPVRPEALAHDPTRRGRRALRQRRAVGAHVGDEPRRPAVEDDALVERLGEAHGPSHPRSRAGARPPAAASRW